MEPIVPNYIDQRIRQPVPAGLPVVPGSTPVIAFGDLRNARVATLGWNPSKLEFLDQDGQKLSGQLRRLETLASLDHCDLSLAPAKVVRKVFDGCNRYFERNPYRRWFDVLQKVLTRLNVSYYDGTACHLDFVQWSTDPVWRDLSRLDREQLIEADLSFLREQIAQEHIQLLLLNGSGIAKQFSRRLGVRLKETAAKLRQGNLFVGRTDGGVQVIGWNLNLQSSFGVSNDYITSVADAITGLYQRD
jgi:hypothetical protein